MDTDESIAECIQNGDTKAFGVLIERYEKKLSGYGRRFLSRQEDVEDMVQEVFMKAFQNIQSFDSQKRFSPWIYRIAHNVFLNHVEKTAKDRFKLVDLDTLISHPEYVDPHESEREQKELRKMIDLALDHIDQKYREVLVLYYLEDISYKDISDILGVPTGTVGVRLRRGRDVLKDAYQELDIYHGI